MGLFPSERRPCDAVEFLTNQPTPDAFVGERPATTAGCQLTSPTTRTCFRVALCSFVFLAGWALPAQAHEDGAPFSGAIIEPLRVHHAHIEDELRVNNAVLGNFRADDGKRTAFENSLELGIAWTEEFTLGSEILIPFSNTGDDRDDYSIGDIEVWPVKYAFVNSPETILTGVLSFTLPTGDKSKGLGEGDTALGVFFLADNPYENWFVGVNAEIETAISGGTATETELAMVLSYSFIAETAEGSIAPSEPNQKFVPALSIEAVFESVLGGDEKGDSVVSVVPGVHLWHPASGWAARMGVDIPISSDKPADYSVLLQFGKHLDWEALFR